MRLRKRLAGKESNTTGACYKDYGIRNSAPRSKDSKRCMKELANPFWIKVKGILFLVLGVLSSILLVFELPKVKVIALLAIVTWNLQVLLLRILRNGEIC